MSTSTVNPLGASSITRNSSNISTNAVNKLIGGRVHLRRTSLDISRQELSKFLRIDHRELDAYEAGAKRINASLLLRTAKILDVRLDYFFRSDAGESKPAQVDYKYEKGEAA